MKLIPIPKSEVDGQMFYHTTSGRHCVHRENGRWVVVRVGETDNEIIKTVGSLDEARSFLDTVEDA